MKDMKVVVVVRPRPRVAAVYPCSQTEAAVVCPRSQAATVHIRPQAEAAAARPRPQAAAVSRNSWWWSRMLHVDMMSEEMLVIQADTTPHRHPTHQANDHSEGELKQQFSLM